MGKLTHWRKVDDPKYLGAYSLMDGNTTDINVTIEKVVEEDVNNANGTERKRVAYLKGYKPMILNPTNSRGMAKLFGSPYIEKWAGHRMNIYIERIFAFGEDVDALRVRAVKELPIPNEKQIELMQKSLGQYSIEDFKKKYTLTPETIKLIENG